MSRSRLNVVGQLGIAGILCGAMVVAASSGCGGSDDPFTYKKISGSVTYDDGSLIEAPQLSVKFNPIDPKVVDGNKYPKSGSANMDIATGKFDSVTSHTFGDGLVPGKYTVTVVAQDEQKHQLPLVGPQYADASKSPLVFDTNDAPWTITVKKPSASDMQKQPARSR